VSGKSPEELRSIAETYGELRLQAEASIRRMRECSKTLFKAFLRYVETRRSEGATVHELLHAFLTEELGLDGEQDRGTRLSLARRFYALAGKRSRSPAEQASLMQYFEDQP
jgi:translation initiation factor 2 beta subunit (eIF-2beta)/eIF-5